MTPELHDALLLENSQLSLRLMESESVVMGLGNRVRELEDGIREVLKFYQLPCSCRQSVFTGITIQCQKCLVMGRVAKLLSGKN